MIGWNNIELVTNTKFLGLYIDEQCRTSYMECAY